MRKLNYTLLILTILLALVAGCDGKESEAPTPAKSPAVAPQNTSSAATPTEKHDNGVLVNPVDGAEMVPVPEGKFVYGGASGGEKRPPKVVTLPKYYIYKHEVTNRQFEKFTEATGYKAQGNWRRWMNPETMDYPVVMVSWNDAKAYCKWAGVKLPSETQWEKAARGADGRIYPWGNNWNPAYCNNKKTPPAVRRNKTRMLFKKTGILPVGFMKRDKSPYGVMDMAGNVSEWTRDWFTDAGRCSSFTDKILKGGSFYKGVESCRLTFRDDNLPSSSDTDYGFRCVWEPDMPFPKVQKTTPEPTPSTGKAIKPDIKPRIKITFSTPLKKTMTNPNDTAEMILIPAGKFKMGAKKGDPDARWNEKPARIVKIPAYYIYKYEVTHQQFADFVKKTGHKPQGPWKRHYNPELDDHPVVYITWNDANAYCKWAGGALPTEAQWEKAARGKNGAIFAWGDRWIPDNANTLETKDPGLLKQRYVYYDNNGTVPVGTFEKDKSPYGVMDMTGNAIEWCRDWYDPHYYEKIKEGAVNPAGPEKGGQKVMRGGGWGQDRRICRSTYRGMERPTDVDGDFGFRCVVEVENK